MKLSHINILGIFSLAIAFSPGLCHAQGGGSPKPVKLNVGAEFYVRYPSLEPVTAISVQLADPAEVYDLMKKAIGADPHHPRWDCTKTSSYKIAVVSKQDKGPMKEVRIESITSIALQGNDENGKRLTFCSLGSPGEVQLIFNSDLGSSEMVQVSLMGLPDGMSAQSDGTLKFTKSIVSFSATPQAAPSEKLTNGKTRDTGQLNLSFSDSNLFSHSQLPFNTYVKSTDLFSTDEKDSKSSFSGTVGIQRGIFPSWYAPLHFEETMQGNQTASNLSSVTTLGITTLVPWSWSGKIFYNSVFQAPLPPDLTVNNQYTHRINQNITPTSKALAINDYSLNPVISWSSIHFPWACKVFGWLNITQKGQTGKAGEPAKSASQYCLGTELNLGTYYLPLDLTPAGNQRVEGYGDVSILIPLSGLSFASKIFPYLTTNDPAKSQIRIKYSDSVTPTNNYARSKQWTYGIELIK
jgi:hypothetical protein